MKVHLLILLFLFGCTQFYSKEDIYQKQQDESDFNTVPIESIFSTTAPEIDENEFTENSIGPFPLLDTQKVKDSQKAKKAIVGLVFGPGAHRVLAQIIFLKHLQQKKVVVHLVSGYGLGALVATMFASGMTPQKMEWLFFKFFNEARNTKPFTTAWIKILDKIIISQIRSSSLQELKKATYLPAKKKVNSLYGSGNLRTILLNHLFQFSPQNRPQWQIQKTNFFGHKFLKKLGVNLLIGLDALGDDVEFKKPDSHLLGIFTKISGKIQLEKKRSDRIIFTLDTSGYTLDSYDDPMPYMKEVEKQSHGFVNDIARMIQQIEVKTP